MAKYGYARVSTIEQNIESQIVQLENEKCDYIFYEKLTGIKINRPQFNELMDQLKPGDTLVVTKLDRIARNTIQALEVIDTLFYRGINIHILNMGIIEKTPTGKLIYSIFSAFAEFERDLIIERTQEGKALAKMKKGFKDGRPKKFNKEQIALALSLLEKHTTKEVSKMTGISEATLYREKRESLKSRKVEK